MRRTSELLFTHLALVSAMLYGREAASQAAPPTARPTGHPPRIARGEALADVRAFAVGRAGQRAIVVYTQAGSVRERGSVRAAMVRLSADGALTRDGEDRTLAPMGSAVAAAFDGTRGVVAYVVPRAHRGESEQLRRRRHRDGTLSMRDSLANPLGTPSLTAGDITLVRVGADGATVGRPLRVFEENARTYRVAVALDEAGALIAWTGAHSHEGEVRGTVRVARIDGNGAMVGAAQETSFSGQVGDTLRWVARTPTSPPRLIWSGEHCRARADIPRFVAPTTDPSAAIETRRRFVIPQGPMHEHEGAAITCGEFRLYAATLRVDGTLAPFAEGPTLARDAAAPAGPSVVASVREAAGPALRSLTFDVQGSIAAGTAIVAAIRATTAAPIAAAGADPVSAVPPPPVPDALAIARAPVVLDAAPAATGNAFVIAALSPTHGRVTVLASSAPTTPTLLSAESAFDLRLAAGDVPWLFARMGNALGGPLRFLSTTAPVATPEVRWPGDERFREQLLRARIARAAFVDLEHTYGPAIYRIDAASNPSLPGLVTSMRRLHVRWSESCEALQGRARTLVRRGVDRELETLARQQCETGPEPTMPLPGSIPPVLPP